MTKAGGGREGFTQSGKHTYGFCYACLCRVQGKEGIGGVVWSRTVCLSVCLTGKLHPNYLDGNRGLKTSQIEKRGGGNTHTHKQR